MCERGEKSNVEGVKQQEDPRIATTRRSSTRECTLLVGRQGARGEKRAAQVCGEDDLPRRVDDRWCAEHAHKGKQAFQERVSAPELSSEQRMVEVERERTRVPIVKIDAPVRNQTPKPLFQRLILECGMSYVKGDNEEELLMKIALSFQQCGVEVVIIDEVEHIRRPELRRRLLEVSNRTPGVPFICASCEVGEVGEWRYGGRREME